MTEIVGARLGIGWGWDAGESGWKPGVDQNFRTEETLIGLKVISNALTAPPGSPADGDTYVVATGGTGAWATQDGAIASYMAGAWYFFRPVDGLRGWFANLSGFRRYNGTIWVAEVTSRNKAAALAQWVSGAVVQNGVFRFMWKAPYAGTVDSLDYVTGNGSFTLAVKINATNVTGLGAVAVSSTTPANATATAANTFAAGDEVSGTVTAATGSPANVFLNLNVTWAGG
jgi:hypothetical protein